MLTNVGVGLDYLLCVSIGTFRSSQSFDSSDLFDKEQVCGLLSQQFVQGDNDN
jgi:hypothetical protein